MPRRLLALLALLALTLSLAACGGEEAPTGPKPRPDSGFAPDACTRMETACYCDTTTECDLAPPLSNSTLCECDPECFDDCGRALVDAGN